MNLEADQAVQEARFAGACQDQHAGRPAPNLGWPGERKSILETQSRLRGLGPGLGSLAESPETAAADGGLREAGTGYPPPPGPPPPRVRKEEGFHPLRY